tara:strand:+ start:484 stop:627 length:144 start_codon:yes stop_codon:yes gene_type:complete
MYLRPLEHLQYPVVQWIVNSLLLLVVVAEDMTLQVEVVLEELFITLD